MSLVGDSTTTAPETPVETTGEETHNIDGRKPFEGPAITTPQGVREAFQAGDFYFKYFKKDSTQSRQVRSCTDVAARDELMAKVGAGCKIAIKHIPRKK
jgi:hypothetical protein